MAGYLGNIPSAVPLTSADIADGIITTAKIADGNITSTKILDGTIVNADINASAGIVSSKLSGSFGSRTLLTSGESLGVTSLTISSTFLTSSYNVFEIFLCQASRTTSGALEMFVSTNNGTNYHNVDRIYHYFQTYPAGSGGTGISSQAVNTDRLQFNVTNTANDFTNTYVQIIRPSFVGGSATNRNRNTIMAETHGCQNLGSGVNIELVTAIACITHSDATNRNSNINNLKFEGNGATMDYKYAIYGIAW